MRVMQLSQYLALGGLEKCVTQLALELSARGVPTLVAIYEENGLNVGLKNHLKAASVDIISWQKGSGFCLRTLFRLVFLVFDRKISVIHSHDLGALVYAVFVSSLFFFRVKVVHTQHSFIHFRKNLKRYFVYERIFPRFARSVCTVSHALASKYLDLGIPKSRIHVIPNGIHYSSSFVSREKALDRIKDSGVSIPERTQRDSQRKILLSLGRVVRGKGLERLVRTWSQLRDDLSQEWLLLVVGPFDHQYLCLEILPLLEFCKNRPIILGATDHPFHFYNAAHAFISLSEQEGMPLAAYEAIGFGLPAILSDIEGHQGLAQHARLIADRGLQNDVNELECLMTAEGQDIRDGWIKMEAFRKAHSVCTMVDKYMVHYAQKVCLVLFFCSLFYSSGAFSSDGHRVEQQLTSLLERPEYLQPTDWQNDIELQLSRGEKVLLTMKNSGFCGTIPRVSSSIMNSGLKFRWYGGIEIPLKKPSFEGAQTGPYVDALIPLNQSIDCQDSRTPPFEWIFLEIAASNNALRGIHDGQLISQMSPHGDGGSGSSQVWNLRIEVFPVSFAVPWRLPLRAEFTPFYASKAHFGESTQGEGVLTEKYIQAMLEHRVLPLKAWIKHPFQRAEERASPSFLLSRDPSPQLSITSTVLKVLADWVPVDIPRIDHADEIIRLEYWNKWKEYLTTSSTDPLERFTKSRLAHKPFVYLWDEPPQEEFSRVALFAENLSTAAPDIAPLVTIYPWDSFQESIRIFAPLLQNLAREGKPKLRPGRELWSYVSCMSHGCGSEYSSGEPDFVVERNSSYIRVWPWIADEYELSAVLYYSVNNIWRKSPRLDPWMDIYDFTGQGDGTLFYPGRPGQFFLKEHTPVPSLRLKFWQQASFDAEYIHLAKKYNNGCIQNLKQRLFLARDAFSWNRNPRIFQEAKREVINCIIDKLRNPTIDP